jgi:hypothetical protein
MVDQRSGSVSASRTHLPLLLSHRVKESLSAASVALFNVVTERFGGSLKCPKKSKRLVGSLNKTLPFQSPCLAILQHSYRGSIAPHVKGRFDKGVDVSVCI